VLQKEVTVKKSVVLKLPITIDVDREKKTYSIEYGKVPPIKMKDGTKVVLQFSAEQSGEYQAAK
jgi:hypothetical protein